MLFFHYKYEFFSSWYVNGNTVNGSYHDIPNHGKLSNVDKFGLKNFLMFVILFKRQLIIPEMIGRR